MENKLDVRQAYLAMFFFLDHLYDLTKDSSLGGFLGSMQLLKDGMPADNAYWEDWLNAVGKATKGGNAASTNLPQ
jgi:hypothetical protein